MGRPYISNICFIFPLCMDLNTLEKSTNNSVALRFFPQTTSMIQLIVRICEVVEQFLQKPFWFFIRIFLISGVAFLKEGEAATFHIFLYCLFYRQHCIVGKVCHQISLSSIPAAFLLVIFSILCQVLSP